MKQERRNKFIAFVAGALATIGILFFTVERRHHDWHHECQEHYESDKAEPQAP